MRFLLTKAGAVGISHIVSVAKHELSDNVYFEGRTKTYVFNVQVTDNNGKTYELVQQKVETPVDATDVFRSSERDRLSAKADRFIFFFVRKVAVFIMNYDAPVLLLSDIVADFDSVDMEGGDS